ncbi:MAG TPA: ModD protein [Gammaproteobacteria bacterium]|nr:ModD protein [Gammaproteobacteria bacterium]
MRISSNTIYQWLEEDLPYFDLTTQVLGVGGMQARMSYQCRHPAIACGTEEAAVLVREAGAQIVSMVNSGETISIGQEFFVVEGSFSALNEITKVIQNIFEYASGVATRTQQLVSAAKQVNSAINILTTRKVFPGTKALSIKAILAGGAYPHRLGLSETILLFKQHIDFVGGFAAIEDCVARILAQDCEKQILLEVESAEDLEAVMHLPIHGIQYDKINPDELSVLVAKVRKVNPQLTQLAAGGITLDNAALYAATGVDGLVTTAVYFGKPADVGVRFVKL